MQRAGTKNNKKDLTKYGGGYNKRKDWLSRKQFGTVAKVLAIWMENETKFTSILQKQSKNSNRKLTRQFLPLSSLAFYGRFL